MYFWILTIIYYYDKKTLLTLFIGSSAIYAQKSDEQTMKDIYKSALTNSKCYAWLDDLSNKIGSRLSGQERRKRLYTQKLKWKS
jgi:hypothetical protein